MRPNPSYRTLIGLIISLLAIAIAVIGLMLV